MMRLIPLTKGYSAMVDDEDFERVSELSWHVHIGPRGKVYAVHAVFVNGRSRRIQMHTLLTGILSPDHIDGDGLNNQKYNLRPATHQQNCWNKRPHRGSSSKFKGVSKSPSGKWKAAIKPSAGTIYLGKFKEECDAAQSYNFAAAELFGKFAWFNTPISPEVTNASA